MRGDLFNEVVPIQMSAEVNVGGNRGGVLSFGVWCSIWMKSGIVKVLCGLWMSWF